MQAWDRLTRLGLEYVRFAQHHPAMFELIFRHDLLEGSGTNLRKVTLPLFAALADLMHEVAPGRVDARTGALGLWTNLHGIAVLVANRSMHLVGEPLDLPGLTTQAVKAHLR
ncbi:TetR-like C-terminal domain-containing protein [Frankia sp. Cr2]|uniref:TetR-like C-terminal domain-containing protein n=1 Tax=Frankia sp. Cr2 TaxID=3073932 RepID=UPI002AD54612|nr:TetR-like C-terminal domain-containing protein [Frankia sp. Cr2]